MATKFVPCRMIGSGDADGGDSDSISDSAISTTIETRAESALSGSCRETIVNNRINPAPIATIDFSKEELEVISLPRLKIRF